MRTLRRTILALLGSVVMVACSEQQPVAPDIQTAANFGAAASNEVVYLHPGRITWMHSDTDPDVLLLGYDPADDYVCNDGQFVGGIRAMEHYVVSMEGFPDPFSAREQYVLTTLGAPPLYLYLRADFPPPGATDAEWCTFLTEGWIASGHWSATINLDNDYSGGDGTPGINSFGGIETGILWGRDGDMYRYEWKYRYLLDADPCCTFKEVGHYVDHVVQIK